MESETLNREPSKGFSSLPRAVWVGGGVLCLAVAALAGALVTKSVDAPRAVASAPAPLVSGDALVSPAATPVPARSDARQDEVPPPRSNAPLANVATAENAGRTPVTRPKSGSAASPVTAPVAHRSEAAPCSNCGTVESVQAVKVKGEGTGVGAVAGGLLGGVVGNQFGHGNGRAAMTVLGAVGGGFAGNEVERRTRAETTFDVRVRMRDGSYRTFRESQPPAVGSRVVVEGKNLRLQHG